MQRYNLDAIEQGSIVKCTCGCGDVGIILQINHDQNEVDVYWLISKWISKGAYTNHMSKAW